MANNLTDVAEARMIDWITVTGTPTRPTSPLKVALYTTAPNQETGASGVEASGGAYARTTVTFAAASTTSSVTSTSNSADVVFPAATALWGTIVAIGIFDTAGTPVLLFVGALTTSKTIDNGDTFKIPAGSLTITLD